MQYLEILEIKCIEENRNLEKSVRNQKVFVLQKVSYGSVFFLTYLCNFKYIILLEFHTVHTPSLNLQMIILKRRISCLEIFENKLKNT